MASFVISIATPQPSSRCSPARSHNRRYHNNAEFVLTAGFLLVFDLDDTLVTLKKVQRFLGQPVPSHNIYRARRTERMNEERRLVWRVLRHWKEIADGGR